MAIKLNGVEITSNKLNGSNVSEEKLNGTKVWPTVVMAEIWKQTSDTNFTKELELNSNLNFDNNYQGCAIPSYLLSQLNSSRPATSEAVGTIIRVRNNFFMAGQGSWCPTFMYYEAVIEPIKQWVYIAYQSSEPSYQYYAYANINTTQEDWVEALEYEFPARDLAVGTMGYVIVQGDTMYPILQVQEV